MYSGRILLPKNYCYIRLKRDKAWVTCTKLCLRIKKRTYGLYFDKCIQV